MQSTTSASEAGTHVTMRWAWLPAPGTWKYYALLGAVGILILGPLGGVAASYMNFSLGFFVGGQVLAGILGLDGHLRLRRAGTSRRELHPDDGGVGRRHERDGGRDPGDDLDGHAAAAGVAAHPVHDVHRHVRRRRRHALHADPGRPPAAHVSVRARSRQHPARADRSRAAAAIGVAALRRHGARASSAASAARRSRRWVRSTCRRRRSAPA